jgi:biopolymer transport protein ExbD
MNARSRIRSSAQQADPNLTPLLDVVLQLIVFFMMIIHFGSKLEGSDAEIRLPIAPAAWPRSALANDRLAVVIDSKGRVRDGDQWLDDAANPDFWNAQAEKRRAAAGLLATDPARDLPTAIILRADRDVGYGLVRRAIQAAQHSGFQRFSLIVERRQPESSDIRSNQFKSNAERP